MIRKIKNNINLSKKNIKELFENYTEKYQPITIDWGEPAGDEIW